MRFQMNRMSNDLYNRELGDESGAERGLSGITDCEPQSTSRRLLQEFQRRS